MIAEKFKRWLIGVMIIGLIFTAAFYLKQTIITYSTADVRVAHVDLEKLLKAHPDWSKYQDLQKELIGLEQSWTKNSGEPSLQSVAGIGDDGLTIQTKEIQRAYSEEAKVKLTNLNKNLAEYSQNRQNETAAQYQEKVTTLRNELAKEIKKQAEMDTDSLNRSRAKIQASYQVELSNLQLQLTMAELALNSKEHQADQAKIQAEIDRINREIDTKVQLEREKLQAESNRMMEKRQTEMGKELEAYQKQLQQELKSDIQNYRDKMENEFEIWRQKREVELKNAVNSRNKQLSKEYQTYSSERIILQAQLKEIKESITWEVRTATKRLARAEEIDLVVTGDIARLKMYDLTPKLETELFQNR